MEPNGVVRGKPTNFMIDTTKAGQAPLDVKILDNDCNKVDFNLIEKRDGVKECSYVPSGSDKHTVLVNYGGVAAKGSPYRVFVDEPLNINKIYCFGPGVENGVKANVPTQFNVNCKYVNFKIFLLTKI